MKAKFKIIKVKRKFYYKGIELRIVDREEPYMNATRPVIVTRVLSENGGTIPIGMSHKETQKSIISRTIEFLGCMEKLGANVVKELTGELSN